MVAGKHRKLSYLLGYNALNPTSGHQLGVNALAQLAVGTIVTASRDTTVRVWERHGSCKRSIAAHVDAVNDVIALPLASVSPNRLREEDRERNRRDSGASPSLGASQGSGSEFHIPFATAGSDNSVMLHVGDVTVAQMASHSDAVKKIVLNGEATHIFSASIDGTIHEHSIDRSLAVTSTFALGSPIFSLAAVHSSPGGPVGTGPSSPATSSATVLVAGTAEGKVEVIDPRVGANSTASVLSFRHGQNTAVKDLASLAPCGGSFGAPQQLASAGSDGVVRIWDMRSTKHSLHLTLHKDAVWSLCPFPGSYALLSGGRDAAVQVTNIETLEAGHILSTNYPITDLMLGEMMSVLYVASTSTSVEAYNLISMLSVDTIRGGLADDSSSVTPSRIGLLIDDELPPVDNLIEVSIGARKYQTAHFAPPITFASSDHKDAKEKIKESELNALQWCSSMRRTLVKCPEERYRTPDQTFVGSSAAVEVACFADKRHALVRHDDTSTVLWDILAKCPLSRWPPRSCGAEVDSLEESRRSAGPSLTPSAGSGFKTSYLHGTSQGSSGLIAGVNDRPADGLHSPADERFGSLRQDPQRKGSGQQPAAVASAKGRWGTAEVGNMESLEEMVKQLDPGVFARSWCRLECRWGCLVITMTAEDCFSGFLNPWERNAVPKGLQLPLPLSLYALSREHRFRLRYGNCLNMGYAALCHLFHYPPYDQAQTVDSPVVKSHQLAGSPTGSGTSVLQSGPAGGSSVPVMTGGADTSGRNTNPMAPGPTNDPVAIETDTSLEESMSIGEDSTNGNPNFAFSDGTVQLRPSDHAILVWALVPPPMEFLHGAPMNEVAAASQSLDLSRGPAVRRVGYYGPEGEAGKGTADGSPTQSPNTAFNNNNGFVGEYGPAKRYCTSMFRDKWSDRRLPSWVSGALKGTLPTQKQQTASVQLEFLPFDGSIQVLGKPLISLLGNCCLAEACIEIVRQVKLAGKLPSLKDAQKHCSATNSSMVKVEGPPDKPLAKWWPSTPSIASYPSLSQIDRDKWLTKEKDYISEPLLHPEEFVEFLAPDGVTVIDPLTSASTVAFKYKPKDKSIAVVYYRRVSSLKDLKKN